MKVKVGARLPPPPSILPSLGRGSVRLPDRLTGLPPSSPPSSPAFGLPAVLLEADGCSRCRLPLAPPLPPELLRLPLTPASGQEEASSPLGLLPRFPAATNGPPPPGTRVRPLAVEDRAGAAAGLRDGPESAGEVSGVRSVAPVRRSAICACHVEAPAAPLAPGRTEGEDKVCHALSSLLTRTFIS